MPISDPLVMPLARELLACYAVELSKVEHPPLHVGLRPGVVVDLLLSENRDECCEGLGWVRPSSFFPSSGPFPSQDGTAQKQGTTAWAVTLEMGIVMCAPTKDASDIPHERGVGRGHAARDGRGRCHAPGDLLLHRRRPRPGPEGASGGVATDRGAGWLRGRHPPRDPARPSLRLLGRGPRVLAGLSELTASDHGAVQISHLAIGDEEIVSSHSGQRHYQADQVERSVRAELVR